MNYLHVFLPRGPVEINKVAGGSERVCLAWWESLVNDNTDNNHYLYSFTHETKDSPKIHENHIVTSILCGKKGRISRIGPEIQQIIVDRRIDVLVNHAFTDGKKMNNMCKTLMPYSCNKKLNIINIFHMSAQIALVESPFPGMKDWYLDHDNYRATAPGRVNTVMMTNSDFAKATYTMEAKKIPPIPIPFVDFNNGFFSFCFENPKQEVKSSTGDIMMIGRTDKMKRIPETLKFLTDYKGGNIHIFTKHNDYAADAILNRILKQEKLYEHVKVHVGMPRDEMFKIAANCKAFISGSYKETGPITMLEVGELGVPSVLAFSNDFENKYPAETILKDISHYSYNVDLLNDNPDTLLDIINEIPEDLEFRKQIQKGIFDKLHVKDFPNKWYAMIDEVVKPENYNRFCLPAAQTNSLF